MDYAYISTGRFPTSFRLKDLPVFFSGTQCLKVIQAVLDETGKFRAFPGTVEDPRWLEKKRVGLFPDVRYEARFYPLENEQYLMLWMIQPSGWHWVDDDGFGFSGDSSITLYSVADETGNFAGPFALFSIDATRYCHDFDHALKEYVPF